MLTSATCFHIKILGEITNFTQFSVNLVVTFTKNTFILKFCSAPIPKLYENIRREAGF